jgi:hypothetical protein
MIGNSLGFRDNVFDTGRPSGLQELLVAVHGEHYHCRFRSDGGDLSRGRKSIHLGHLQVQDHYVGVQFFDFFNSYLAILCLATDPPIRGLLKARPERMADESTVVDDQN